uniref:Uncharacterized protein n=1 Tax=viral metagenome TaxID=1070528 RepID=A0A6C0HR65_9ZZZZ
MEELKKSESNIFNFITNSLKGSEINYSNGNLPVMDKMRTLGQTTSLSPSPSFFSSISPQSKQSSLPNVLKLVGVLLLLFLIFKIAQHYLLFDKVNNGLKTVVRVVEKDLSKIGIKNPLFNTSNNLNSNQILDFLLTKPPKNDWCFVGESDKNRYCTLMQGEKCMSGNIFPSKDICVNPKLKI